MATLAPRAVLRDVGERVIREGNDCVCRPLGVRHGRAALARVGPPAPQVLEDAPYDARIVDQGDELKVTPVVPD